MNDADAYRELGLHPGATADEVKRAYRRRVKVTHPDHGGSDATFKRTVAAYEWLTRPGFGAHGQYGPGGKTGSHTKARPTPQPAVTEDREAWLLRAFVEIGKHAGMAGLNVPPVRLSVGYGRGGRRKPWSVIPARDTVDQTPQAFISPEIDQTKDALDILAASLSHVLGGAGGQALGAVWRIARSPVAAAVGPYPHAAATGKAAQAQTTRLLKASCPDCGYVVRLSRRWADVGLPTCPCGTEMELA